VSISSRRFLATVYAQVSVNDGGYASNVFTPTGAAHYCNVVETSARERLGTTATQHTHDAMIEVADEVSVPQNAMLVVASLMVGGVTAQYQVRGVIPRPRRRALWLVCERTDVPLNAGSLTAGGLAPADGTETANGVLV
jgi:hypothetical protein